MIKKIALEEFFLPPGLIDYWTPTVAEIDRASADGLFRCLTEFGELRLRAMDRAGIARAVLSVAGPGVQAEPIVTTAVRKAKEANDFLAREIRKQPQAFLGFAHLPTQDARAAADELERCVRELEFCGAMIHGHCQGRYLDEPALDPLWERAAALDALVCLGRADPVVPAPVLAGFPLLRGGWEGGFEAASHALRLIFGGVFDRHPKAKVALGRLGEGLPYLLSNLDALAVANEINLQKRPSDYFRDNIFATTSALLDAAPLYCAVNALGPERVMFGAGYPFEPIAEAGRFLDTVRLDEGLRADIAFRNAERVLGL